MPITQDDFDEKWCAAMRGGEYEFWWAWGGTDTIGELRKENYFPIACHPKTFGADVVAEAEKYQRLREAFVKANPDFKATKSLLVNLDKQLLGRAREFQRLLPVKAVEPIVSCLWGAANDIRNRKSELRRMTDQFWQAALSGRPFADPYAPVAMDPEQIWQEALAKAGLAPTPNTSAVIGRLEYVDLEQPESVPYGTCAYLDLPAQPSSTEPELDDQFPGIYEITTKRNLDTYFQISVVQILHQAFPKLSKTTIAKLVVLVHICCDLVVRDDKGRLQIKPPEGEQLRHQHRKRKQRRGKPTEGEPPRRKRAKQSFTWDAVYQKIKGPQFPW